jgi:hypothetical protein
MLDKTTTVATTIGKIIDETKILELEHEDY